MSNKHTKTRVLAEKEYLDDNNGSVVRAGHGAYHGKRGNSIPSKTSQIKINEYNRKLSPGGEFKG